MREISNYYSCDCFCDDVVYYIVKLISVCKKISTWNFAPHKTFQDACILSCMERSCQIFQKLGLYFL